MSAIDSFIQVYQQGSSAFTSAQNSELQATSYERDLVKFGFEEEDQEHSYGPIENLPTASPIESTTPYIDREILSTVGGPSPVKLDQTHSSFFHSPLKWFMKRGRHEEYCGSDCCCDSPELGELLPIGIITDSALGEDKEKDEEGDGLGTPALNMNNQELESNAGESMLVDGEIDPVYETYVKYVYYSGEFELGEEEFEREDFSVLPKATQISGESDDATPEEYKKGVSLGQEFDITLGEEKQSSVRRFFTSKTRQLLRQLSHGGDHHYYDVGVAALSGSINQTPKRTRVYQSVSRTLSHMSVRRRCSLSKAHSWRWSGTEMGSGANALVSLFDDAEFHKRLSLGDVSSRRDYENFDNENENETIVDYGCEDVQKERETPHEGSSNYLQHWTQRAMKRAHGLRMRLHHVHELMAVRQ